MAMATLMGFQMLIQKKQMFSGWSSSDIVEKSVLGGDGGFLYVRQVCRSAASAITARSSDGTGNAKKVSPSKKKGSSKGVRGEPVMAFRDQVAVCLASATLEQAALPIPRGGVAFEEVVTEDREWSLAVDSATSIERSRLESQWLSLPHDSITRSPLEVELDDVTREGDSSVGRVENSPVASGSHAVKVQAIRSGKPKARLRRMEARQQKLSCAAKPAPEGAFTIFKIKKPDSRSDVPRKIDGVQDYLSTYMREISKIDRLTHEEEIMLAKIIRTAHLMKEERNKWERALGYEITKVQWASQLHIPVSELEAKLHEADLARDRMVMANLRLVVSVVKRYHCEGLEVADLIQEGSIGLLKGVEKFDYSRGYKLSTYVHWWIRQGVTRAIADHSRTVRLPVHVHDTLGRIRRTRASMLQDGDPATVETICEALNLSNNQVKNALMVSRRLKSLDMQVGHQRSFQTGDNETLHNFVADKDTENQPWTMVERATLKEDVQKMLSTLGARERDIMKMHFGVDSQDGCPMSLENISHRYGISRERVRQLERAAKQKLRNASNGLDKFNCMLI